MELRGIRFCKECANILNPIEQLETCTGEKWLSYSCRVCEYKERARRVDDMLVYHHQVKNKAELMTTDYKDYPMDATLPRLETLCPKCGHTNAVYFHSDNEVGKAGMKVTFVCAKRGEIPCGYSWS